MWFTIISSLLSALPGTFGEYFSKQKELGLAQVELQKAQLQAQITIAQAQATAETDFRTAELGATSPKFKQSVFYFFSGIILYSVFFPSHAASLWSNLNTVPQWFETIYVAMVCAIWGIPVAKEWIGGVFSGLGSYVSGRREYKLEKLKAINEAKVFASLRKSIFTKGLTAQQVNDVQAALKAGLED